jgi:hypothetical protein
MPSVFGTRVAFHFHRPACFSGHFKNVCHQNGTLHHSSSAQNVDVNPKFSKHFRTPNLVVLSITTTVNLLRLKTFAVFVLLHKRFGVFTRRHCLVRNRRFGTTCMFHHLGLKVNPELPSDPDAGTYN